MGAESDTTTLLFDVDGTLCEYERGIADLLSISFERTGIEPFFTAREYEERFSTFVDEYDDVDVIREESFASLAKERGRDPERGRTVARAYAAERDHARVRWRDGAREALNTFEGQYRLGAVTNGGPDMQRPKLETLGVLETFETVVYAGAETAPKPDPEPFEEAFDRLAIHPTESVYVGNSLNSDVAGARNAGLPVAWLSDGTPDPRPEPDFVLETPRELLHEPWLD